MSELIHIIETEEGISLEYSDRDTPFAQPFMSDGATLSDALRALAEEVECLG